VLKEDRVLLIKEATALLTDQIFKNSYDFGNNSYSVSQAGFSNSINKTGNSINIPEIVYAKLTQAGVYFRQTGTSFNLKSVQEEDNFFDTDPLNAISKRRKLNYEDAIKIFN
jgi:hypothetical protein